MNNNIIKINLLLQGQITAAFERKRMCQEQLFLWQNY